MAGVNELGVKLIQAKIGMDNAPSLNLFREKLSFVEVHTIIVFVCVHREKIRIAHMTD